MRCSSHFRRPGQHAGRHYLQGDRMPTFIGHALVTGAPSGIGAAIAHEYARRGIPLILTARRAERLESLADSLRQQVAVDTIAADLSDPHAPRELFETIAARGL